ncbi:MAG: FAD:protein FMN transferase [Hyphomicrobiaceae bacterium]
MGTTWNAQFVQLPGPERGNPLHGIERELDNVVAQMSTWETTSAISAYNSSVPGTWHRIEAEFMTVLSAALEVARKTDGAYDPTIGAVVGLWGFGPEAYSPDRPSPAELAVRVGQSGWTRVELDADLQSVLQPGGVHLDLSSIAKGFGVDQVARYLRRMGCSDFLVEVGGELRGEGTKPDGTPWWVLLEQPPDTRGNAELPEVVIALHGLSIATSGDYRRRRMVDGAWQSHVIDPRTGRPVGGDVASVSVVAADCMTADAWATALMVLGLHAGLAVAERENIAAQFVCASEAGSRQVMSPAMRAMLG